MIFSSGIFVWRFRLAIPCNDGRIYRVQVHPGLPEADYGSEKAKGLVSWCHDATNENYVNMLHTSAFRLNLRFPDTSSQAFNTWRSRRAESLAELGAMMRGLGCISDLQEEIILEIFTDCHDSFLLLSQGVQEILASPFLSWIALATSFSGPLASLACLLVPACLGKRVKDYCCVECMIAFHIKR